MCQTLTCARQELLTATTAQYLHVDTSLALHGWNSSASVAMCPMAGCPANTVRPYIAWLCCEEQVKWDLYKADHRVDDQFESLLPALSGLSLFRVC